MQGDCGEVDLRADDLRQSHEHRVGAGSEDCVAQQVRGIMNLRRKNTSGNVLMVTLCTVAIAGVALGVYLKLTSNEHQLTMRSLAWNNSLMIAEGGIEEALTHAF